MPIFLFHRSMCNQQCNITVPLTHCVSFVFKNLLLELLQFYQLDGFMNRFFSSSRNRTYAMADISFIVPHESRSLSARFSSLNFFDSGSFSYDRLPSETLRLSILKLDSSCFHVEVPKTATVAELKKAVEATFAHMPKKGPGKISWTHVWGQFCLCYVGHKLVTETDYLRDHGIKDGDQLHFMRHVSTSQRNWLKKRVAKSKQHKRSLSQMSRYQQKEHSDDNDISLDDIVIENGKVDQCNTEENRAGKSRITGFLGGLFSDTRMAVVRRARIEGKIRPSMIAKGIVDSFRKIRSILSKCSRQHYSRRRSLKEY